MKVLIVLILLYIFSNFIVISQIENLANSKKEIILENHKSNIQNEYKVIVNILRNLSQNTFRGFIDKPYILQAFAAKDRILLYNLLEKDYNYLAQLGFKQVHFHLPNNDSFLRMHQPQTFGDNLEKARFSVTYTNKYKKFIEGIEVGKVVPGYRFVYPLFLNNEYLGSVELSFSINKIVNEMEKVYKTHVHYLIPKDIYTEKVFDQFHMFYMPSIEHKDYIKLKRSYLNKIEPWYGDDRYKQIATKGLETKNIFNFELDIQHGSPSKHIHKVVTFLPVKNIENNSQSYFVFYNDSHFLKLIEKETFYFKSISSILLLLFFILLYILYKYRESIIKSKTSLEQFNKTLTKKVDDKTKELNELNKHLEHININLEKRIQQEVAKNREKDLQLFSQAKKASMGEMVGAIAHQWRQPLNELAIRIQKLRYDYQNGKIDEAFLTDFIETNKKTINFMSKTIDGFRNFFRIDKEKKEFKIKEAITDIVLMLNAQLEHLNIEVTIEGEEFIYEGFKTEFQQVILNILNNAKEIIVDSKIDSGKITINIEKNHIVITDNAGGVPLHLEQRIFEPYFTTKDEGHGTGMGLYISKIIIEDNMQGKLYLQNSKEGATFHIEL